MENYIFSSFIPGVLDNVRRGSDGACIPFDLANNDYVQFLKDWENGAEVLNPDGSPAPYVAPETP